MQKTPQIKPEIRPSLTTTLRLNKLTLFKATSTFPPALRQLIKIACILTPFLSQHHENVQMHIDEENVMQLLAIWQDSLTMDVP